VCVLCLVVAHSRSHSHSLLATGGYTQQITVGSQSPRTVGAANPCVGIFVAAIKTTVSVLREWIACPRAHPHTHSRLRLTPLTRSQADSTFGDDIWVANIYTYGYAGLGNATVGSLNLSLALYTHSLTHMHSHSHTLPLSLTLTRSRRS